MCVCVHDCVIYNNKNAYCVVLITAGGNYVYITMCMYTDEDGCPHIYYILYNNDDIDEFIFVAEEQSSELYVHLLA